MSNALVPLDQMQTMAAACAKSGLFGAKTPEQALTIMLLAQAEGRHPMSAAADYDLIGSHERGYKPAKKAQAMLRDFLAGGGSVTWHKYADDGCDATFSHPQGGEVRVKWDKAKMQQAQIKNDAMYNKFPAAMYRSRCVSEGVRTVYPMATGGLYVPEEARAIQAEKDMGPAPVVVESPTDKLRAALKEAGITEREFLEVANKKSDEASKLDSIDELADADVPGALKWIASRKKAA